MKNIERLISSSECSRFMELVMKTDSEKTEKIPLYFNTSYEKYLFQTLVYNNLVRRIFLYNLRFFH
jgi:hypothetical protein